MAGLVKKLDELVAANEDKQLAAIVNFIDVDQEDVAQFAEEHGVGHVALTSTDEKNAERFQIAADAEVTAMHYKGKKVVANVAVASGGLDEAAIAKIIDATGEILKEEAPNDKRDKKKERRKKT